MNASHSGGWGRTWRKCSSTQGIGAGSEEGWWTAGEKWSRFDGRIDSTDKSFIDQILPTSRHFPASRDIQCAQ